MAKSKKSTIKVDKINFVYYKKGESGVDKAFIDFYLDEVRSRLVVELKEKSV